MTLVTAPEQAGSRAEGQRADYWPYGTCSAAGGRSVVYKYLLGGEACGKCTGETPLTATRAEPGPFAKLADYQVGPVRRRCGIADTHEVRHFEGAAVKACETVAVADDGPVRRLLGGTSKHPG